MLVCVCFSSLFCVCCELLAPERIRWTCVHACLRKIGSKWLQYIGQTHHTKRTTARHEQSGYRDEKNAVAWRAEILCAVCSCFAGFVQFFFVYVCWLPISNMQSFKRNFNKQQNLLRIQNGGINVFKKIDNRQTVLVAQLWTDWCKMVMAWAKNRQLSTQRKLVAWHIYFTMVIYYT